jgi:hypothetical protein
MQIIPATTHNEPIKKSLLSISEEFIHRGKAQTPKATNPKQLSECK